MNLEIHLIGFIYKYIWSHPAEPVEPLFLHLLRGGYRHAGSCHMKFGGKQRNDGDWEQDTQHTHKEWLTGTEEIQLFFVGGGGGVLNHCSTNSITCLQQDSTSVKSGILIIKFTCSSAQTTVYFPGKTHISLSDAIMSLFSSSHFFFFFFLNLRIISYSSHSLPQPFYSFSPLLNPLFHCPVLCNIFLLSASSSCLFFSVFPPISHSLLFWFCPY